MTDQLTFDDPRSRHPVISPPVQQQPEPGLERDMHPRPDVGATSYRGLGRLAGRRALVTGADSGIGAAVAIAFAREGADLTLSFLPEEEDDSRAVIELARAEGRSVTPVPGDLRDPAACRALVDTAADAMGGLDAVVNVAGRQRWQADLADLPVEEVRRTYETNVLPLFWIVHAALPHLRPGSTIVNTASLEAYRPAPDRIDYASTKAAVNNLSKGMAQQLIGQGIRVNVVAPGPTWTALQVSGGVDPQTLPEFGSSESPIGRAAQPVEQAPAYVFLTSPESSFVVGETLNVNGGMPTP